MAFSASLKAQSIAGNIKMEVWSWNAAGVTTGSFSSGISTILHKQSNNDVTEDVGLLTNSGQTVTISGVTSNDTGTIVIFGIG